MGKVGGLAFDSPEELLPGLIGLGHTRWATHGRPSDSNAHPHTDCHKQIAVVHNGIVENYLELKTRLQGSGHDFSSETDTEVITHLIEEGMDQGLSFRGRLSADGRADQRISGCYRHPPRPERHALRTPAGPRRRHRGSHREGQGIVGSDLPALLPLFRHQSMIGGVGFLDSGEMAVITREGASYFDLNGRRIHKQTRTIAPEDIIIDKGGYRHFMLKEIMEQPQSVASALRERVDFQEGRVDLPISP